MEKYSDFGSLDFIIQDPREQKYHFYLTNLQVEVSKLRKLYQLRWQIELFFKSLKQSLGMEKYKTTKLNILVNLVLASGIAQVLGIYLFQVSRRRESAKNGRREVGSLVSEGLWKFEYPCQFVQRVHFIRI